MDVIYRDQCVSCRERLDLISYPVVCKETIYSLLRSSLLSLYFANFTSVHLQYRRSSSIVGSRSERRWKSSISYYCKREVNYSIIHFNSYVINLIVSIVDQQSFSNWKMK